VFAWVRFDKVGSSTMRLVMNERIRWHGWDGFNSVFNPVRGKGMCHATTMKRRNHASLLSQPCHSIPCADVPPGYVVQSSYSYCEHLLALTGRDCRYITVLREPIARLVSDWNYHCLGCRGTGTDACPNEEERRAATESNRQIKRDGDGVPFRWSGLRKSCPDMSVADYAAFYGNPYLTQFGVDVINVATDSTAFDSILQSENASFPQPYNASFDLALRALRQPNMVVLFTEDLSHGAMAQLWQSLNETMPVPKNTLVNPTNYTKVPDSQQTNMLRRILAPDIELYWRLRSWKYERPRSQLLHMCWDHAMCTRHPMCKHHHCRLLASGGS